MPINTPSDQDTLFTTLSGIPASFDVQIKKDRSIKTAPKPYQQTASVSLPERPSNPHPHQRTAISEPDTRVVGAKRNKTEVLSSAPMAFIPISPPVVVIPDNTVQPLIDNGMGQSGGYTTGDATVPPAGDGGGGVAEEVQAETPVVETPVSKAEEVSSKAKEVITKKSNAKYIIGAALFIGVVAIFIFGNPGKLIK